jgi:hypothetical protein
MRLSVSGMQFRIREMEAEDGANDALEPERFDEEDRASMSE